MIQKLPIPDVLERTDELLEASYKSQDLGNKSDPLDELVYILLSLQTDSDSYQQVFRRLRDAFPTWEAARRASLSKLERILRPAGLAAQKASYIKRILEEIRSRQRIKARKRSHRAHLSLDFLRKLSDKAAETFLRALPGVGPKSARCVLLYSLGRKVFPVDVNVFRIFTRMGLARDLQVKKAHDYLQNLVASHLRRRLHVNLVHHGRAVCTPIKPRCDQCVLISFCKTGLEHHRSQSKRSPVAVDLFSGAGSLSAGFSKAGWTIALAVEANKNAAQSYRFNHPGVPVLETDVVNLSATDVLKTAGLRRGETDALIGGPPCQGYSAAGKRMPRTPMNFLYKSFLRLGSQIRAKSVIMENVPGMRNVNGRGFVPSVLRTYKQLGYVADKALINAVDFGSPQTRRRLIFIGTRRGLKSNPSINQLMRSAQTNSKRKASPTVRAAFQGLPRPTTTSEASRNTTFNHRAMKHSKKVIKKIRGIKPGSGPISYRRLSWRHARTIIAGHRALPLHPSANRSITVREAARIQTIPDSFRFLGPHAEQPLQVANAVPFVVAERIGKHLTKVLAAAPHLSKGTQGNRDVA